MCVLGAQRTAAMRTFVKRGEPIETVNPFDDCLVSFVSERLGHATIVDGSVLSRGDTEGQSRSGTQYDTGSIPRSMRAFARTSATKRALRAT
jgi:hypothetical protein